MSSNSKSRLRCAVYTRKSSEEGLDQEFNSLDAQLEACVAFIASQIGLGWKLVPDRYDDGGISGGTMERPALQRLLQDIRDKKVEVVVVYKIDRLTRSLMDFSKIVEIFDASSVSFVSVTQQFNTTTSMGRLTLNVLLSFAQFEREVTAERIRDKIAASKKKGMWMGGVVPLGYRVEHRKLVIDDAEAKIVRHLFDRYLALKSVRDLADEAARDSFVTRTRERQDGTVAVTMPFGRGNLYHLLSNPIYIGRSSTRIRSTKASTSRSSRVRCSKRRGRSWRLRRRAAGAHRTSFSRIFSPAFCLTSTARSFDQCIPTSAASATDTMSQNSSLISDAATPTDGVFPQMQLNQ